MISGGPDVNEILIVGDIGRDHIHCAVRHVLFLIQNGKRFRPTLNMMEGYRILVNEKDATLEKVLLLHLDPVEFVVEREFSHLPNVNDPAWRCTWENVRPDLAPHFKPLKNFNDIKMFTSSDTFSGSRRKEGSV
jgi:hypothetical protein